MLSKKAVSRVTKLITFAETLPPEANEHFRMQFWFTHEGNHKPKLSKNGFITKRTLWDCGSKACMFGWAAAVPGFWKAGLRVVAVDVGETNLNIAKAFFDLTEEQAAQLFNFGPGQKTQLVYTPQEWAVIAKELLSEWSAS